MRSEQVCDFRHGKDLNDCLYTSGDVKAVVTVYHAPVDPQAVPSLHVTQGAVTHLALQTQTKTLGINIHTGVHCKQRKNVISAEVPYSVLHLC